MNGSKQFLMQKIDYWLKNNIDELYNNHINKYGRNCSTKGVMSFRTGNQKIQNEYSSDKMVYD